MADLPKYSAEKTRALKALPYSEYLISPWWRLRRHARLTKAGGKCERCAAVVRIADVHHVHYDRRGEERDSDLEVLCRDCHGALHFDESRRQHIGQYEMLARETLRLDKPQSLDDFKDLFRARCVRLHLPIDHRFDDTISIVWKKELVSLVSAARRKHVAEVLTHVPELPSVTKAEVAGILRRLGRRFPFRSMPEQFGSGVGVAAIRTRAENRLKGERCPACRWRGAIMSRVDPGWLFCVACHHKWEIPAEGHAG